MDCNIQNIKCEICGRAFHKVCHAEPFDNGSRKLSLIKETKNEK